MATYGLTASGFIIPRYTDIVAEINASFIALFGPAINLRPDEFLGQLIGVFAGREAYLWEQALGVYNSYYPETSQGVHLDNVSSITGIQRLPATFSMVDGVATGTLGTVIPSNSFVSVINNSASRFRTTIAATIGPGTNAVQHIAFSAVPDAGNWSIIWNGQETSLLAFNAAAAAVQTALNALIGLTVTVSGNYTSGFTITFTGASGSRSQPVITIGTNTLTIATVAVTNTITQPTPGLLPNVVIPMIATTAGPVSAPAHTLTVIETVIAGWTGFSNPLDAEIGKAVETDGAFRLRRKLTLSAGGSATVNAIRTRILEIVEVRAAFVFENTTDVVDAFGRPPHSFEAVVLDGDDTTIAQAILAEKPAGIQTYRNPGASGRSVVLVDSQGFNITINFSRPTPVLIYLELDLHVGPTYPVGPVYTGTFAITAATNAVVGTGTHFLTDFTVGTEFSITDGTNRDYFTVTFITDDTHMTVAPVSGHTYAAGLAYPDVGNTSVRNAVVTFANTNFGIGDDVYPDMLFCPIESVQGIQTIVMRIGTAPGPVTNNPIPINVNEIAIFDTSRILIRHV